MPKRKILTEIILICLGGVITVGLSVNSLIKQQKQEKELKESQSNLISAQKEIIQKQDSFSQLQKQYSESLNEKSNTIIELQEKLQEKTDSQLREINKLKNPIPNKLHISFKSNLVLTDSEFKRIRDNTTNPGNLLPSNKDNVHIHKVNKIRNLGISFLIEFINNNKVMSIKLNKTPIPFTYFNSQSLEDSFLLTINDQETKITFIANKIETDDISTNYSPPTLLDFKKAKVTIKYNFWYPFNAKINGTQNKLMYMENHENDIFFKFFLI